MNCYCPTGPSYVTIQIFTENMNKVFNYYKMTCNNHQKISEKEMTKYCDQYMVTYCILNESTNHVAMAARRKLHISTHPKNNYIQSHIFSTCHIHASSMFKFKKRKPGLIYNFPKLPSKKRRCNTNLHRIESAIINQY